MSAPRSVSHTTHAVGTSRGHSGQKPTPVTAHVLSSDQLIVEVWDHGARLVRVEVPDRNGHFENVILRHPMLSDYDDPTGEHAYFGATIGRYANRISNSSFRLDGVLVNLDPNEGKHQLHGGPIGFDQYVWQAVDNTQAHPSISFRHVSLEGDHGYPGRLTMQTSYSVEGNELRILTSATTTAPTVVGTTNHAYWNLAAKGSIANHELQVAAEHYIPIDRDLIPIGKIEPVDNTSFDYRLSRPLVETAKAGGIDHCYVFNENAREARLKDVDSGRTLSITTNQPALQVYTGQYLARPFAGVCLEPQAFPDTPNRPTFGSSRLLPGDTYEHATGYVFTCEKTS